MRSPFTRRRADATDIEAAIETIKRRVYSVTFPLIGVALTVFTVLAWRSRSTGGIEAWGFPAALALMVGASFAVWFRWIPLRWLEYGLLSTAIVGLLGLMAYSGIGPNPNRGEATALLWWLGYWLPVVYGFIFMVFGVRTGTLVAIGVYALAMASVLPYLFDPASQTQRELLMLGHTLLSNLVIIVVLIGVATILWRRARHSDRLEGEVHTDVLTGLPNRRYMSRSIVDEMARTERYGRPFSIVLFDLDHFKLVNDRHGHPVGDEVLKQIGPMLAGYVRETDTLGRWGGEEFLVVLPEMDVEAASRMAERLRTVIAEGTFPRSIEITASFGVVRYRQGESMAALLERVDRALYSAKDAGRNRVAVPPVVDATSGISSTA